jgi:hypothetical protein
VLDEDTVQYLTTDVERAPYEINFNSKKPLPSPVQVQGEAIPETALSTSNTSSSSSSSSSSFGNEVIGDNGAGSNNTTRNSSVSHIGQKVSNSKTLETVPGSGSGTSSSDVLKEASSSEVVGVTSTGVNDGIIASTGNRSRSNSSSVNKGTVVNLGTTNGDGLWRLCNTGDLVNTGPKGWIFVLWKDKMYAGEKKTSSYPRFHHSSFFAGGSVNAAGMVVCVEGKLTKLFPHSGHYRPHDKRLYSLLAFLRARGIRLEEVQVDVQRVMKMSRQLEKDGAKARKAECALYMDGEMAYCFLKYVHSYYIVYLQLDRVDLFPNFSFLFVIFLFCSTGQSV